MNKYDWFLLTLNVMSALVLPILAVLWKLLVTIHTNDLAHIQAGQDRIERKLDAHIEAHAEGRFGRQTSDHTTARL